MLYIYNKLTNVLCILVRMHIGDEMNKRLLSFLLMFSLLILPVSRAYAWSWSDWQGMVQAPINFISQSVDKDIAKKLFPVLILATLAALYLFMGKKSSEKIEGDKNTIKDNKKEELFKKTTDVTTEESSWEYDGLKQYRVYSQFSGERGGGGASCGYHTLLRAMQIVNAKSTGMSEQELEASLQDWRPINQYFAKGSTERDSGEWRSIIWKNRILEELKKIIYPQMLGCLKQLSLEEFELLMKKAGFDKPIEKVNGLYASGLGAMRDHVALYVNKGVLEGDDYSEDFDKENYNKDFDKENIFNEDVIVVVGDMMRSIVAPEDRDLTDFLAKPEIIDIFIDIKKLATILTAQKISLIEKTSKDDVAKDSNKCRGEWLSADEINYLWNYEKEKRNEGRPTLLVPTKKNKDAIWCGLVATDSFDYFGNQDLDTTTAHIESEVVPHLGPQKRPFFQIFGLGTMSSKGSNGHWYPLVMHQDVDGALHWYITDSGGNRDRTKDLAENARKIKMLVEQKVKEKLQGQSQEQSPLLLKR